MAASTMRPATAVETAATMESGASTSVETTTGVAAAIAATVITAPCCAMISIAAASIAVASTVAAAVVSRTAVKPVSVIATPMAVIPGAYADEYAVIEVVWSPIAIRGTGIRRIRIVAVGANWFSTDANANSHPNLRCLSISRNKQQNS